MTPSVLILDGGAAHAVALARCLRRSGYRVGVLCDSRLTYGYASRYPHHRHLAPDSASPAYAPFLLRFLKEHPYDVLLPTSDHTAEQLCLHRDELSRLARVLMPAPEVFYQAYDKGRLMRLCRERGFPHPLTVDLRREAVPAGFPYPALIKPNVTSGARGMTLVHSDEQLRERLPEVQREYGDCHLQRYIPKGGRLLNVLIMTDREGALAYSSVIWERRIYPLKAGSSSCSETIDEPRAVDLCYAVTKAIGWVGFADFDLIEDPTSGELLVMEMNPRVPACVRCALESGVDYATLIADASLGRPLRAYRYRSGARLRHLGFDVLWFLRSKDRLRARPSWFRFFGRRLYYQDWLPLDVLSFLAGTLGNVRKIMNPEFRRAKGGAEAEGGRAAYRTVKRAADIVCALAGLVLTSPLWMVAALGILVSDRGPLFYTAHRIGQHDRPFRMYKFRSMRVSRSADEASLRADEDRIFPFGRFMRRTKMDELPQLLNILNGTMSVVGPRPVAEDQRALFRTGRWQAAARVPVGLTGPAALFDYLYGDQITDEREYMARVFPTRRELEYAYVRRASLFYDARMIVYTILAILYTLAGRRPEWMLRELRSEAAKTLNT